MRGSPAIASYGYPGRGKRFSTLATFDYKGFVSWYTIDGTFDKNAFIKGVKEIVLPHIQCFPGRRSVVILDNASIHHTYTFVRFVNSRGGLVLFTPPYCFDCTPLDNGAFGCLVHYLRANNWILEQLADGFPAALDTAFENAVSRKRARKCMYQCGYESLFK